MEQVFTSLKVKAKWTGKSPGINRASGWLAGFEMHMHMLHGTGVSPDAGGQQKSGVYPCILLLWTPPNPRHPGLLISSLLMIGPHANCLASDPALAFH